MATSMNYFWPVIQDSSTHQVTQGKRLTNQTTIVFVGKQDYEQPYINYGILDIKGWCPIKRIVTKCSRQNTITTLCGTNTLQAKEGHNDDDDNDTDILDEAIEAPNGNDYHERWPKMNCMIGLCLEYWIFKWQRD